MSAPATAATESVRRHTAEEIVEGGRQYGPRFTARWDRLIDWERRAEGEGDFFVSALLARGARSVLDMATGTGFHSVMALQAGLSVLSVDGSPDMIEQARSNARERGVVLDARVADWRELRSQVSGPFDAVLCLGSSLPHLFDESVRRTVLRDVHELLAPGGVLVVDHRNFDRIRAHRYASSGKYYYCGRGVDVSVDHVDERLCRFRYGFPDGDVHFLEVFPVLTGQLRDELAEAGFATTRTFGDFSSTGDIAAADFVIHVAEKAGDPNTEGEDDGDRH